MQLTKMATVGGVMRLAHVSVPVPENHSFSVIIEGAPPICPQADAMNGDGVSTKRVSPMQGSILPPDVTSMKLLNLQTGMMSEASGKNKKNAHGPGPPGDEDAALHDLGPRGQDRDHEGEPEYFIIFQAGPNALENQTRDGSQTGYAPTPAVHKDYKTSGLYQFGAKSPRPPT